MNLKELRTNIRNHPIIFSVILTILAPAILFGTSKLITRFEGNNIIRLIFVLFNMFWPLLLVFVFGYSWCLKKNGFIKTLKAGAFLFVLQVFAFITIFSYYSTTEGIRWKDAFSIIIGFLSIVGVGFREELLFRGIIANALANKYWYDKKNIWKATIISGILFGLAHLSNLFTGANYQSVLVQTVVAAVLGIYLTAVYYRGGNIWALILIHTITDMASLFLSSFTNNSSFIDDLNTIGIQSFIMLPVYILIVVFLYRNKKINDVFNNISENKTLDLNDNNMFI